MLALLTEAAAGRPLVAPGELALLPRSAPPYAVLGFPGRHVIAAPIEEEIVHARLKQGDLSQPMSAGFLLFLAGWLGAEPGTLDVLLAARGAPSAPSAVELWPREDLVEHPRVQRAARYRFDLAVYATNAGDDPEGIVAIGRGLAGRHELAFEVAPRARGQGLGRRLAAAARGLVPGGAPLFAQVAPANSSSLRAVLAAGFRPIGSEVLFTPA